MLIADPVLLAGRHRERADTQQLHMRSPILIALLLKAVASNALHVSRHGGTFKRGRTVTMLTNQQNAAYGGHPPHGKTHHETSPTAVITTTTSLP